MTKEEYETYKSLNKEEEEAMIEAIKISQMIEDQQKKDAEEEDEMLKRVMEMSANEEKERAEKHLKEQNDELSDLKE